MNMYEAIITTRDGRNNTQTIRDYCYATSVSEAARVFRTRYPGATISGVQEA